MSELLDATVLRLPSVSISTSAKALQFSGDGQATLLARNGVHILTPDAGVNLAPSSGTGQALGSSPPSQSAQPLGWLRTIVEFDRCLMHQWPADCQDWSSVCLGSLDPALQALALSPSNLTSNAGCVFALLNSNLELTIWGPSKNFLTGPWARLQDVTSVLQEAAAQKVESTLLRTLHAQSTCIEWSSQPDWGLTPAPTVDASLLAVGDRAGSVSFLRYDDALARMVVMDSAVVSDRWLSHLAWSAWTECQGGICEAMLACAAADGSVSVVKVRQSLTTRPSATNFFPEYQFGLTIHASTEKVWSADGKAVTAMKWANVCGLNPVLIFHKAGAVHLWRAQSPQNAWAGCKVLILRTQRRSVGSSALYPASGICYIHSRDLTIVSLSDGSFHAIHNVSVDPTLDPPPSSDQFSSGALSANSRAIFLHAEPAKMTFKDVDRVNGMTAYDDGSTFMWTYEASRPTDFSYKHDAKHMSTMVVAQIWDEDLDERVIQTLAECIGHSKSATGEAPMSRLRPIFVHLRDSRRIARLHGRILDTLHHAPLREPLPNIAVPVHAGEAGAELTRQFVSSLSTHLFGWDGVLSERLRYAVAAFCQKVSVTPDVKQPFAEASDHFAANVRTHFLLTLLRHLAATVTLLNANDVYFAQRVILLASAPVNCPELAKEAGELSSKIAHFANVEAHGDLSGILDELCPACHATIPLDDIEGAVCANGHVWARCCITSFPLATPMVRTCVGCSRKALLPASCEGAPVNDPAGLPNSARSSWVLRDLLNATRRCPFCGNHFVTLV
ncbi:putative zinc-finger of transcription factor IIIC complex-domain-containing protein [Trametes punicea]|nr:putative zinc-finger of transcription factor IIIC complex-domain-containing protein [Trametes punicea]